MFDIGFWELCLIAVVALLILGPERLPVAARTAGLWIGKAKRMVNNVKGEIDRELQLDELRQRLKEEELKVREGSGLSDLTEMAENTIVDIKSFNSDLDTHSPVMDEGRENLQAETNESGHGEFEPSVDDSQNSLKSAPDKDVELNPDKKITDKSNPRIQS